MPPLVSFAYGSSLNWPVCPRPRPLQPVPSFVEDSLTYAREILRYRERRYLGHNLPGATMVATLILIVGGIPLND